MTTMTAPAAAVKTPETFEAAGLAYAAGRLRYPCDRDDPADHAAVAAGRALYLPGRNGCRLMGGLSPAERDAVLKAMNDAAGNSDTPFESWVLARVIAAGNAALREVCRARPEAPAPAPVSGGSPAAAAGRDQIEAMKAQMRANGVALRAAFEAERAEREAERAKQVSCLSWSTRILSDPTSSRFYREIARDILMEDYIGGRKFVPPADRPDAPGAPKSAPRRGTLVPSAFAPRYEDAPEQEQCRMTGFSFGHDCDER